MTTTALMDLLSLEVNNFRQLPEEKQIEIIDAAVEMASISTEQLKSMFQAIIFNSNPPAPSVTGRILDYLESWSRS